MTEHLSLSVYMIARNEADRIGRAIASVRALSDDIVVVTDGQSADDTENVARAAGAQVVENAWSGFGAQKYFAEGLCRHDWVLCLDADEYVTPYLAAEIRSMFAAGPAADFYDMSMVDVYPHAARPRMFCKATRGVRLFRKSRGRTSLSPVHDRVDVPAGAAVHRLRSPCWHYSIRSLAHLIQKYDAYTTAQAATLSKSRGMLAVRLFTEYPVAFFQYYILHGHFTGGLYGFLVARICATARAQRVMKMWEHHKI